MLICSASWLSQLRLWLLLRIRHGFHREGRAVVGAGEAIARDFVRGSIRLEAGVDDVVGTTLLSQSEAGDAFLQSLAATHG